MAKTTFLIRCEDWELSVWRAEAERAGQKLSVWIRERLAQSVTSPASPPAEKIDTPAAEVPALPAPPVRQRHVRPADPASVYDVDGPALEAVPARDVGHHVGDLLELGGATAAPGSLVKKPKAERGRR